MHATTTAEPRLQVEPRAAMTEPSKGSELAIGTGFEAQSFRARDIGEPMDPFVMVDHYVMTAPTFGVHPHAGLSAVTLLFEDSAGRFRSRDSLGNDIDLQPGDLYWLKAGRGAVHDEYPRTGARTHGLQVFVNVPQAQRYDAPDSLLVRARDMPVINSAAYRVKVALGTSNGVTGAASPSTPTTMLDGILNARGRFKHRAAPNRGLWIHAIRGSLTVSVQQNAQALAPGQAMALHIKAGAEIELSNPSSTAVQFALFDAERIGEAYVQEGPFVMGSAAQIKEVKHAYQAGRLGSIADQH